MNNKILSLVAISILVLYYIVSYTCIYTAYIAYNVLSPLNPEYRSKEMIGTKYSHFYVNINGHDLFLNPLRNYSDDYKTYGSNENYIDGIRNWGYLYVPVLDIFINKNGVLQ